jgi:signal transduction histidine kinase
MPAIPVVGFVLEACGAAVLALILRWFARQRPRSGVPEWSFGMWALAAALLLSIASEAARPLPVLRWPLQALAVVVAYWSPALVLLGTWARWNDRDPAAWRWRLMALLAAVGLGTVLAAALAPGWGPLLRSGLRTLLTAAAQLAAGLVLLRDRRRDFFGTRVLGFSFLGLALENALFTTVVAAVYGRAQLAPALPSADHLIEVELLLLMFSGVGMVAWLLEEERESAVRLQEVLQRKEALSAMGALVAGVAHEVRNPLFGISSTVDAFAARVGGNAAAAPYLDRMRELVARLSGLMTELLDYGKPVAGDFASASLTAVVGEALEACGPLAARAGVTLAMEHAQTPLEIRMDGPRLRQVFQNLVQNAVEHTPAGGRVLVGVQRDEQGGHPGARCSVRDSGPGFDVADLPHVFEPFFTRRRGGTGLGLSIVQRIVELHAGRAWASNHPEGGGVVTVWLPSGGD